MLHELQLRDNHSYMVGSCDVLDPKSGCPACSECGYRTDPDYTSPSFLLRQKRDASCCYDGAVIVSARFRDLAVLSGNDQLVFTALPRAPGYFHLKSARPLVLDLDAMGTERKRLCPACGLYRDVHGHALVLAAGQALGPRGLNLSHAYFGSNNEAAPMVIAGEDFVAECRALKMTGIDAFEAFPG
jgi:hypothetical protein